MIGKTHNFSIGYSSGFVPDCRYAIETVRGDQSVWLLVPSDSEDSCLPKRVHKHKCGSKKQFQCPHSSYFCLKDVWLEKSSKVRILQNKIICRILLVCSGVALSLSSDGHAKKQQVLKWGISGRFKSMKQAPPPSGNSVAVVVKPCETLLRNLMQHKYSWVFKAPVDIVRKKLASGSYSSPLEFASDVRLTFTNAMTYNPPGDDVRIMADTLNKIFEKKWKPAGEKLGSVKEVVKRDMKVTETEPLPPPKKRKANGD